MSTLRDKVLAECKAWANTNEDFDAETPPKEHPIGWEIWECQCGKSVFYEFHKGYGGDAQFIEWFPHSDEVEDNFEQVAAILNIEL